MSVYGKSKMGKYMLIGGMIGGALSMLSRETRSVWGRHMSQAVKGSGRFIQTMYQNPSQVGRYMSVTGTRLKGLAREVSDDFQQMVENAEKARTSTGSTYQYVMEAGSELGEIATKIKRYGQNMSRFDQPVLIDSEQDALQRLENETSVPNPGTMPRSHAASNPSQTATLTKPVKVPTAKAPIHSNHRDGSAMNSGNHSK
ncbi:MAG: hypothetical protein ABF651_11925 [Sporolactobacillus sp.]